MNNGRKRIAVLLNLVPLFAWWCFPFVMDILFTHTAYIIIYVLVPFICVVVASEPSEPDEAIITKEISPLSTKEIYLYNLFLPLFIFVILLRQVFNIEGLVEFLAYNVVMIVFFCLMLYLAGVVSIKILEGARSKGG